MPTATSSEDEQNTAIMTHAGWGLIVWGGFLFSVFIVGCLFSMQTTESWVLSNFIKGLSVDFSIIQQFLDLCDGHLPADQVSAFFGALSVQAIVITQKLGMAGTFALVAERYKGKRPITQAVRDGAKVRTGIWGFLSILILCVDALTDFVYTLHLGFWQAVALSTLSFADKYYLGTYGMHMFIAGIQSYQMKK